MAAPEHNNWLMIGEALLIIKTTLDPYVQQVVSHWHQMLLRRLPNPCSNPHNCRASRPLCPSCIAWRDELRTQHKGGARNISWMNTDCTKWALPQGSWEVAKVFMAYLGPRSSQVIDAQSTDISGLLNVLRFFPDEAFGNNPVLRPSHPSIKCVTDQARNSWAHSPKQEMTTLERDRAIDSLKQLLIDPALAAVLGNRLKDLQKLEFDGITNISLSERECLTLLGNELSADVAEIRAVIDEVANTSNAQGFDIQQLKNEIRYILSALDLSNQKLEENSCDMQQQMNVLVQLKEEVSELENGLAVKLANLETNQNRLETRQDRLEENYDEVNTRLAGISEKVNSNTLGASLQTCLPDFQDKVFGRDACIDHFSELLQQKKKPCVVLFGGPGFGKTTVAINVAHKLTETTSKLCLFVSLREMRSIKDICRELLAQVGQHPKEQEMEELFQWARSLKKEVVFVLDNAEDALQGDIKDAFCDLLQKLRSINSRCIQFLITSRERFSLSAMEVTCEEIKKLDIKEGIEVIRSIESNPSNSHENLDTFTELAHLCGGIPLALRMIGSLLSYVDEIPSLIEELKTFPMKTLEDATLPHYHQSVCGAFECSFKRLEGSLQAKLVRLSVFKGPFTQQAAAKILDCQERPVLAGRELKKLTDKALLSKRDPMRRYEMHSLVQKYLHAKEEQYQNDFDTATNNFKDHYASVIIEGHKMFWSKDKFKDSVQMFRDDNLNIEIALEMCYQDTKRMIYFSNVWSISMYLEMCISLEKLNQFLESCSTSASSENEKGTEMEAQCFLAYYEWKKAGNSEKYKTHFNNAKKLFEEEENTLSQSQKWLYKHSYGMLLDQQRKLDEAYLVTKDAEEIAEKNTDTTDLSLTLNQLGIIEKRRKNFPEAESCFKKSHDKRKEVLGENHILTVPKHLADLYLQRGQHDKALVLYERGLDTYKSNHMNKEKQCINLLKNKGACHFKLGQMEKSLEDFHKAIDLAEMRLEGDQYVKVLLCSELANACYVMKNKPKAREYAQEALEMAERLSMSWGGEQHMRDILKELEEDRG